jgi:hypothetical protein
MRGFFESVLRYVVCAWRGSVMCGFRLNLACDPMTFPDALWLISITILTVGYGEIFPHSHGGRIIAVLAGIVGIFVATATIVMTFEFLKLSRSESKVRWHLFTRVVVLHRVISVNHRVLVVYRWFPS